MWAALALALGFGGRAHAGDDFKEFKPAPGREVVKPMKPDWCAHYKPEDRGNCDVRCEDRQLGSFVDNWKGETGESDLPRLAALACDFPDNANVQKQVASFRQSWINRTGLSEKDDRAALQIYVAHTGEGALDDAEKASCAGLKVSAPPGSVDYQRQLAVRGALCHGDPLSRGSTLMADATLSDMLWMERPDKPVSQIALAYYVLRSLPIYNRKRDDYPMIRTSAEELYPLVSVLAARLDRKALDAESAALGLTGLAKGRTIVLFGGAEAAAKAWGDVTREDAKSDKKLAKAMAQAESGFSGWSKVYQDHKAALDLAYAVEDKVMAVAVDERSKPHELGCEELRKTLKDYIVEKKPKSKDDIKNAATDVVGYSLLSRLVLCDAAEGRWADAAAEQQILATGRFVAGPYTAAMWSVVEAGISPREHKELKDDVQRAAASILDDHVRSVSTLNEKYDPSGGVTEEDYKREGHMIEQGRVAVVKKSKAGIEVSFKKEKWSEPDFKCTNTGRIAQWKADGSPQYIEHCVEAGSHVEEFQLEPRLFTERSAAGIKAGQIVKVVTSEVQGQKAPPLSFLLEIDEPAKGKKPPQAVSYFGISLK